MLMLGRGEGECPKMPTASGVISPRFRHHVDRRLAVNSVLAFVLTSTIIDTCQLDELVIV